MASIIPFKAAFPNLDLVPNPDLFFGRVKEEFPGLWEKGCFIQEHQPAIYIYRQVSDEGSHTGVIAYAQTKECLNGGILPHEKTLEAKRHQMLQLFFEREAHIKPTLLTYKKVDQIESLIEKSTREIPVFVEIEYEGIRHIFWKISNNQLISEFSSLFRAHVPRAYIADGHHRTEAATILYRKTLKLYGEESEGKPYDSILAGFFSSNQLAIYEFNRVVTNLNNYSPKGFKAELRKYFIITKMGAPFQPEKRGEIGMYISKKWYKLVPKPQELARLSPDFEMLDVSILNDIVLRGVLKIRDVSSDGRVIYVEGPKGLKGLEKVVGKNSNAVAFSMFPVHFNTLAATSEAGKTLPPKSTWFEPRMKNGIILSRFFPATQEEGIPK